MNREELSGIENPVFILKHKNSFTCQLVNKHYFNLEIVWLFPGRIILSLLLLSLSIRQVLFGDIPNGKVPCFLLPSGNTMVLDRDHW